MVETSLVKELMLENLEAESPLRLYGLANMVANQIKKQGYSSSHASAVLGNRQYQRAALELLLEGKIVTLHSSKYNKEICEMTPEPCGFCKVYLEK